jgi:hypothetical protein
VGDKLFPVPLNALTLVRQAQLGAFSRVRVPVG